MRNYIFTAEEEEQIIRWLREGKETKTTTRLLSRIRNSDHLLIHIELLALCLRKLETEGRLPRRLRLPSALATKASSLSEDSR